jgi:NMD protein affecting ribosome stability and mRNA decay
MNGRKARAKRQALRARGERLLAEVRAAVPVRVAAAGERVEQHEVWQRGPATMVLPVVPLDAPEPVQTALTLYRTTVLTFDCPRCDNEVGVTEAGIVRVRHASDCPAHPDRLVALGAEHGIEVQRRS